MPLSPHGLKAGASLALLAGIVLMAAPAQAQITQTALFRNLFYQQTDANTLALTGSDFDARLFTTTPLDVSTVSLDYPGPGTPAALAFSSIDPTFGTIYEFNSGELATLGDVEAAYPLGTYTVNYDGGLLGPGSVSTNYAQDAFPLDAPVFDPATYTGLQGLSAGQPLTLKFDSFGTNPVATEDDLFLTIYDATTGAVVYSASGLTSAATSALLPAGVLLPGTAYDAEVDFSERINGTDPGSGVTTFQGFDQRTTAAFTTAALPAVPEPAPLALLALGALPLGLTAVKRRRSA